MRLLSSKLHPARFNIQRPKVIRLVLSAIAIVLVTRAIVWTVSSPTTRPVAISRSGQGSNGLAGRTVISTTESRIPFIPDDPNKDLDFITLTTL
jgi:hypothetical protein